MSLTFMATDVRLRCDDDPWSTLVENLWSSGMQVSYTIAPAMHTALFTLIRSRRVCELTCTCGHLGRLGRHECERHIDLPKRDSWMYRHITSPSMPAACPMVNGINCRGRCAMRQPSPRIVRAVAYRWSCGEAAGRKVWEVTQADYDRNVAYYTPTNSTSQLAAGGARHRPV